MTADGPIDIQVTFDTADPHRVARFWAIALHYEKEDHSAFVAQLVDQGRLPLEATAIVDGGRQFADVTACRDPEGRRPRLFFQRVPEAKTVKNRVHLDLHVGKDRIDEEVARLLGLGATPAWESNDRGGRCVTMRDVEGNEFCVE